MLSRASQRRVGTPETAQVKRPHGAFQGQGLNKQESVLVCSEKITMNRLTDKPHLFLTVQEGKKSELKAPADSVLSEGPPSGSQRASRCVLAQRKGQGTLWGPFIRALIPPMRAPTS